MTPPQAAGFVYICQKSEARLLPKNLPISTISPIPLKFFPVLQHRNIFVFREDFAVSFTAENAETAKIFSVLLRELGDLGGEWFISVAVKAYLAASVISFSP